MRESIQNASVCSPYVLQKKCLVICQVQCSVLIIKPAEWLHQWFLLALMKGTPCLPGFHKSGVYKFLFPTLGLEKHGFRPKEPRPQIPSFSDMVFKLMKYIYFFKMINVIPLQSVVVFPRLTELSTYNGRALWQQWTGWEQLVFLQTTSRRAGVWRELPGFDKWGRTIAPPNGFSAQPRWQCD